VTIDAALLRSQCERTIERTDLAGIGRRIEGKVRDCYVQGGRRVLVATDRVSAFDVVLGTIPFKGQVLNQLAAFWFERTGGIAPNHVLAVPDPNVTVARECRILPVEFVVRGYLSGGSPTSIWTAYARGERRYCGHALPEGMHKHQRLPRPLLTPTTKAEHGQHDELTSRDEVVAKGWLPADLYERAERMVLELFAEGTRFAEKQGLILVDTKYELGFDAEGELRVVDEIHTPDSSRYWYRESYEPALAEGGDPRALDKEYVRAWLVERGWRGEGRPPELPVEVRCEAARRYVEAYERVTGQRFAPDLEEPLARIRRHLGGAGA
jgi:phosphoribosylaminoimidazole-succinocarboxamide synthase